MLQPIRVSLLTSFILLAVAGCDGLSVETVKRVAVDAGGSGDTATDTGTEDVATDAATDTGSEDVATDTAEDTATDTAEDTATDTAEDTATDTAEDTATDAGEVCGNGSLEAGEGCDDGNVVTEECAYEELSCEVCNATCQLVPGAVTFCGDGFLDPTELCDEGSDNGAGSCSDSCDCAAGFHLELEVCASDTRSCVVPNGAGAETWNGGSYDSCTLTTCDSGYHANGNACDANVISCSAAYATAATQTWTGSAYGTCTATACASSYHVESGACASDTRSCSAAYATAATQTWTGSAYGACTATGCDASYHLESGACVSDRRSCAIANGTGSQNYTSGGWGTCTVVSCNSDYHLEAGACTSDTRSCSIANGTGTQTWSGGAYGSCSPESCNTGYRPFGSICIRTICGDAVVDPAEQCDDGNAVTEVCAYGLNTCEVCNATCQLEPGAATYCGNGLVDGAELCDDGDGSETNGCTTGCICSSAFHLEAGACTSDTRSCSSANATVATQSWNSGTTSYGSCTATACSASYHIESGACVSDTRSCSIANGTGTQTWSGGAYGTCAPASCNATYHIESGACVSDTRSCSVANGTGSQSWTGSGYGTCAPASCNANYHLESGLCTSNTRSCSIANGTGTQSWSGGAYGTCAPASCNATYHIESGACVSDTRSCIAANATAATESWTGTGYGVCTISACSAGYALVANSCVGGCGNGVIGSGETCDDGNAVTEQCAYGDLSCTVCNASCQTAAGETDFCTDGVLDPTEFCDDGNTSNTDACNNSCTCGTAYHAQGGVCASNVQACAISFGTGTETWNGSSYGPCTLTSCDSGYHAAGNVCASNVISCSLANATAATQTWNSATSSYGTCTATACSASYHIEAGACVSDTRSCAIANGAGSQTYAAGGWGTCTVVSCNSGYHAESGACASNTRTCSPLPANTTAGTQTWNSATSSYGTCTATACSASYHIESGACVSDTRSCAIANGAGSQTYAAGGWGTCTVVSCNSGYHAESGACASDTRTCSPLPANTTAGTQTWNSATSSYGTCTASACATGYTVSAGACVVSGYALGTACTGDAQCGSGFCSTGPTGTANDRCAPTGMNYIPAGTFSMGSPSGEVGRNGNETQHSVTLTRSFFIGETEVTQGQWKALSGGANPSCFQATTGSSCSTDNANDGAPVEKVDWFAAALFANAKSAAEGLTSCYTLIGCTNPTAGWFSGDPDGCADASFAGLSCTGYRLPTEAEWEYAARAGTTTATYSGNINGTVTDCSTNQANLDGIAWWCRNAGSKTRSVRGKTANSFGLYDMSGNVSEWVNDRFDTYPGTVTDPLGGTSTGTGYRSIRGGSWLWTASAARSAARYGNYSPTESYPHLGFRLARTAP